MSKNLKYIDIRSIGKLLGTHYPFNLHSFAKHLDEYLRNLNDHPDITRNDEKHIPERLLLYNIKKRKRPSFDLMSLDVDFMHIIEIANQKSRTSVQLRFRDAPNTRRKDDQRVVLHFWIKYPEGTQWLISLPLQSIMKGWGDVEEGYMGYSHSIALFDKEGKPLSEEAPNGLPVHQHFYYRVTRRNWLKRMAEHFAEIKSGSNKTFHKVWREYQGRADVGLASELVLLNVSYENVMAWEELMVDECMDAGNSLNMIPGGFKGLKFLHEHRITHSKDITLEERDKAIYEYAKQHPRLGVPNFLISELWKDDEYAANIICGSPGRLSVEQIRTIRNLHENGLPIEKILKMVGSNSVDQVKRVLAGKTYTRIH